MVQTHDKLYMHIQYIHFKPFSFDLITTTLLTWQVAHQTPDNCQ
jgi:hypothetical protein